MSRASVIAEKEGIPSATIIARGFTMQAKAAAKGMGFADLPLAEYPGAIMNHSDEELRRTVETTLLDNIVTALTQSRMVVETVTEPSPEEIVFEGGLDEVNEYFLARQWSDGLPIVPPTLERVGAFLGYTDRRQDESLGSLLPENREATIWNVAVNGVMAGCRPEYMPVLVGIAEAVADPVFHLKDAGATPGWEPLVIVNGPVVKELNFNAETAVMRVGRQANTSIGRFVRLYMRNIAGLRIPPESTDKGTIGLGLNVVLAENEDALDELGWESFASARGFSRSDNVVTVQSALAATLPIYSAGSTALEHMEPLVEVFGANCGFWAHTAARKGMYFPLLIITPGVAKVFATEGWSKADVQKHLFEHSKVSASALYKHAWQIGFSETQFNLEMLVEKGVISEAYVQSSDPERLVPVFIKPEWIGIVVAGDPNRNQSRGFVQNHDQAPPISKKIELPQNWDALRSGTPARN